MNNLMRLFFVTLLTQELQIPRIYLSIAQETPLPSNQQDPMIARGLERVQDIGIVALVVILIIAIGLISRRVEYAILFALGLSIVLIFFFFLA